MVCHGMEDRTVCHVVDASWDGGSDCVSWDGGLNSVSHSRGLDDVSGSGGWDALRVCLDPLQPCAVVTSTSVTFEGRGEGLAAI